MDATKTSTSSWKNSLWRNLRQSRKPALVGVGQDLRGDDAAGLLVIRELQKQGARSDAPLFVEAGPLPESATGPLRRYQPDLIVFIDAADMGAAPGTIGWLGPQDLTGISALSHALPLSVLFGFLAHELGCEIHILGLQPAQTEFDTPLSPEMRTAVERVVATLREALAHPLVE
jgi:hydrogenase 3 maturation protease